jgi:hypothetical protein
VLSAKSVVEREKFTHILRKPKRESQGKIERPAFVFLMKQALPGAPNETGNNRRRELTIAEGEKWSTKTESQQTSQDQAGMK